MTIASNGFVCYCEKGLFNSSPSLCMWCVAVMDCNNMTTQSKQGCDKTHTNGQNYLKDQLII